jgi:hypothetical protein
MIANYAALQRGANVIRCRSPHQRLKFLNPAYNACGPQGAGGNING